MRTKKETSELLNVSISTIDKWMKKGFIKFVKYGENKQNSVRFKDSEIERIKRGE